VEHVGHSMSRVLYFFLRKGNANHQLGRGFFVHHRRVSAVTRIEFIYSSERSLV